MKRVHDGGFRPGAPARGDERHGALLDGIVAAREAHHSSGAGTVLACGDGDPCYQLRLELRSGRPLPLHSMHRHDRDGCGRQRREIHDYLGLA